MMAVGKEARYRKWHSRLSGLLNCGRNLADLGREIRRKAE
jgi:hypothetical protein